MNKNEAIEKAKDWYDSTKEDAHVVDFGGTFEWFAESYFKNGFEGGTIVFSTSWD